MGSGVRRRVRSAGERVRARACPAVSAPAGDADAAHLAALRRLGDRARTSLRVPGHCCWAPPTCCTAARRLPLGVPRPAVLLGAIPDARASCATATSLPGGGVTAGIDMALTVMAQIAGACRRTVAALSTRPNRPDSGRPECVPRSGEACSSASYAGPSAWRRPRRHRTRACPAAAQRLKCVAPAALV
jgi:hypothetical protein